MYQKLRQFRFEYVVAEKALLMPANPQISRRCMRSAAFALLGNDASI